MNDLNLVILGTSIMWGQGLNDADKMHQVLARMLQARDPQCNVNLIFLAHSGSSTGYKPDGSVDRRHEPRIHGEVPTAYPTILQQIDEFDQRGLAPEAVDIVLFDAGVNDVHSTTILDPRTTPAKIEALVEIYCHQHIFLLVEKLLAKFPRARIIILGYYEFLTEDSEKAYIRVLLKALGKVPGGPLIDMLLRLFSGLVKHRLLVNCDTFSDQSFAAFQHVANEANKRLSDPRVFVVHTPIKTENAAFASHPWLFGINDDLSCQDPMAKVRADACRATDITRKRPFFCSKASIGHPNPRGAKAYAEAIFAVLQGIHT